MKCALLDILFQPSEIKYYSDIYVLVYCIGVFLSGLLHSV